MSAVAGAVGGPIPPAALPSYTPAATRAPTAPPSSILSQLPPPPALARLESARAEHAAALLRVHRDRVESVRAGLLGGDPGASPELESLATDLVGALRVRMAAADRRDPPWLALARAIDARLPTPRTEQLDGDALSAEDRARAIEGMDAANRRFGTYARFLELLAPLLSGEARLTLLDLASGHGGFPLALARSPVGRNLHVIATDRNPSHLLRLHAEGLHLELRTLGALEAPDACARVDLITCTQAMHHFGPGGTARVLHAALRNARRGICFVDVVRSLSHVAAARMTSMFVRSAVLRHDSVLSFRKAFAPAELRLVVALVPGGEALEVRYAPPGFVVVRTRGPVSRAKPTHGDDVRRWVAG